MTLHTIFIVASLVCFLLAAWMSEQPAWSRLVSLGLAALIAAQLV